MSTQQNPSAPHGTGKTREIVGPETGKPETGKPQVGKPLIGKPGGGLHTGDGLGGQE